MEPIDLDKKLDHLEDELIKFALIQRALIKVLTKGGVIGRDEVFSEAVSIVDKIFEPDRKECKNVEENQHFDRCKR